MGNDISIDKLELNHSLQTQSFNQSHLIQETNLQSMNPMHQYTNYKTSMSIKTFSSLKVTNDYQICQMLQSPKNNLLLSLPLKKQELHSLNTKNSKEFLEIAKQKQGPSKQNFPLRLPNKKKTANSGIFLKQNIPTQSIDIDSKSQSELSFKSLVINFQDFVGLKEEKIGQYYDFKQVLGEGAYGQVFRAICKKTGEERAIKKIKIRCMKEEKRKQFISELSLLSKLCHPSIILVYDVYLNDNKYYVVMEYCKGGAIVDMLYKCKNKSEKTISYIMKQLLCALSYMHSQNIVHRDIKLDNIVFLHPNLIESSGNDNIPIKIIDFGTAVTYQGKELTNYPLAGTLSYMAPQVLRGILTTKSDIWSAGVLLIILLTGKSLFKGTHQSITKQNINNKQLKLNQPPLSSLSPQAKDLIRMMLERNPHKRITAAQALNHPWFTNTQKLSNPLKIQNLQQLLRYQKGNNLISVIQSYISLKRITQEEREKLGEIFSAIDTDGNGTIDIHQLVQIYNVNVDSNYTTQELTQIFKSIDKDRSGKIDFNQFIVVMEGRKNLFITEFLADAFDYYDEDKTGYLDRQEVTEILKGGDIVEIDKIIKQLDKDGDKRISKEEFISYFKNY